MRTRIPQAVRGQNPQDWFRLLSQAPAFLRLVWGVFADRRVGLLPRLVLLAAAAYVALPADLVPDLAPILGQMDDLTLGVLAVRSFLALAPQAVVEEHRARTSMGTKTAAPAAKPLAPQATDRPGV